MDIDELLKLGLDLEHWIKENLLEIKLTAKGRKLIRAFQEFDTTNEEKK